MSNDASITYKQLGAIRALLDPSTPTVELAAKAAGVHTATLYRWMNEARFMEALADAQGSAIDDAVRNLTALSQRAILVLHSTLMDKTATPSVRLRAATAALELLLKLKDSADFEKRLRLLERGEARE